MNENSSPQKGDKIIVHVDVEIEDLVPGFLENRCKDIGMLEDALARDDYETIRILGHTMKGAGGGYGYGAITDIGGSLEIAAKERNVEAIRKWLSGLRDYLERVEAVYE